MVKSGSGCINCRQVHSVVVSFYLKVHFFFIYKVEVHFLFGLVYGFRFAGYIPICLSPVFLASCIFGEESISKEDLLTSFMYYVTADDREVLTKCLSGDLDCHDDDLLELLSSYKCFKLPSKDNIKVLLMELAHQEIIQKPSVTVSLDQQKDVLPTLR